MNVRYDGLTSSKVTLHFFLPAQIYVLCTHFNSYLLTDLADNSAIHLNVFWNLPFFVLSYFQVSLSR